MKRITINLTDRTVRSLELAMQETEANMSDVINQAIRTYGIIIGADAVYIKREPGTELERVFIA